MIGEIKFKVGRRDARAVLTDKFTWSCNEKTLEEYLNQMCAIATHGDRRAAVHLLYQVGERLGGEVRATREDALTS
jgi:hypothetical protein